MLSLIILALPLLFLGPMAISLGILRYVFPHNTLKISPTFLVPLAVPFFLLVNAETLYHLKNLVPFSLCVDNDWSNMLFDLFWVGGHKNYGRIVRAVLKLYWLPAIYTFLAAAFARRAIEAFHIGYDLPNKPVWQKAKRETITWWLLCAAHRVFYFFGSLTANVLINDMVLMATATNTSAVMCDVSEKDGYLFCGIFSEYHYDDQQKLQGISLKNSIRYKANEEIATGKINIMSYLLPSQGTMYFPLEKIQNFHLWKVHCNQVFEQKLTQAHHPAKLAWLLGLQWSLPRLNLGVKVVGKSFQASLIEMFTKDLARIRLTRNDVNLTFDNTTP